MSVQTTYTLTHGKAFHGALADLNPTDIISRTAVGAVAFGIAVSFSGAGCAAGGDGTAVGISLRDLTRVANTVGSTDVVYDDDETVSILRSGYVYLTLAAGGTQGAALKYADATGVIDVGTAGTGETQLAATLEETISAGATGLCRINA